MLRDLKTCFYVLVVWEMSCFRSVDCCVRWTHGMLWTILTKIRRFAETIWMVQIVPPIRRFELCQIYFQIDFQMISEKKIYDWTIRMNKLNDFRVNRLVIFFSDQAYDLTSDIWGTNSQPENISKTKGCDFVHRTDEQHYRQNVLFFASCLSCRCQIVSLIAKKILDDSHENHWVCSYESYNRKSFFR